MELAPLISSLLRPQAYPGGAKGPVELLQTHISYILLTPEFAYKIKKPVDFGFLDFTTLEKRLRMCSEEVRLNRRLAPGVYIGVVGITATDGEFFMEGQGQAVEYAVKMRRIPEKSMLENRLAAGEADAGTIERVAGVIASFHERAERSERISSFGSPEVIGKNTAENFAQTVPFIPDTISEGLYERIKGYTEGFLKENGAFFAERAAGGFTRDCHGDIHCEHVSVADEIDIIDCIEFNERFRFSDTISDAAFLSMDLDFHNRHDLSRVFEDAYIRASGDTGGRRLLNFYKCYRAYVRGKVEGFKSAEPEVEEAEKTLSRLCARRHFHLSGMYAAGGYRAMMVVVRGLSGTGKSTVARRLSRQTGFEALSTDRIRKELAGIPPDERRPVAFEEGIYSPEFTERTYAELLKRASALLGAGRPVILDATFSKKRLIERACEAATGAGASFYIIECEAPEAVVRERMEKRRASEAEYTAASDADWGIYLRQKQGFEAWDAPVIRLDTATPLDELISSIAVKIFD